MSEPHSYRVPGEFFSQLGELRAAIGRLPEQAHQNIADMTVTLPARNLVDVTHRAEMVWATVAEMLQQP